MKLWNREIWWNVKVIWLLWYYEIFGVAQIFRCFLPMSSALDTLATASEQNRLMQLSQPQQMLHRTSKIPRSVKYSWMGVWLILVNLNCWSCWFLVVMLCPCIIWLSQFAAFLLGSGGLWSMKRGYVLTSLNLPLTNLHPRCRRHFVSIASVWALTCGMACQLGFLQVWNRKMLWKSVETRIFVQKIRRHSKVIFSARCVSHVPCFLATGRWTSSSPS